MTQIFGSSISSTGNLAVASGEATLWNVNVNTGAAGAILKVYNNVSAVAADLVATIDCSAQTSLWYGISCKKGIYAVLSVGNADVTVGHA